jgi:hypothetical protein
MVLGVGGSASVFLFVLVVVISVLFAAVVVFLAYALFGMLSDIAEISKQSPLGGVATATTRFAITITIGAILILIIAIILLLLTTILRSTT